MQRISALLAGGCALLLPTTYSQTAPAGKPVGIIVAAKVSGAVRVATTAESTDLKVDTTVSPNAKVTTATDSTAVLAFSNAATLQIGNDSELVIEKFDQEPFVQTVNMATAIGEPSTSQTRLALNRGEVVASLKKLNFDRGSYYLVQTPVGAVGVRGTDATLRIVFRNTDVDRWTFQLSVAKGLARFLPTGAAQEKAISVPAGQEIKVSVRLRTRADGAVEVVPD